MPARELSALRKYAISLLAVGFGLLHRWHVTTLFESNRHFSHLSEMEREMSFRTEMGMYYSYYKTIVEANSFTEGLMKIERDNISEYGHVINAAKKYSLLPELNAGFNYRIAKSLGILGKEQCWQIERGDGLSSVISCEGLGVPVYFYLEIVWLAAACTAGLLFEYSVYLSDSLLGGIVTMLLFFYNHNECTRVQWSPPLRETFAYPLLLYQMYSVTIAVREYTKEKDRDAGFFRELFSAVFTSMLFATTGSLCSWQLSSFVFSTQIIAFLILRWLRIIPDLLFDRFIVVHATAVVLALTTVDGDRIMCSLYVCLTIGSTLAIKLVNKCPFISSISAKTHFEIILSFLFTRLLMTHVFKSEDYAHVFDILKSKLTNYKDFHTMLYTCAPEFDFLQYRTYEVIFKTFLFPIAVLAGVLALYCWYRNYRAVGYPKCIEADMAYNALQTGAFIIMAILIMRLKLFMTPQICIIAGSVCSKRYLEKVGLKNEKERVAVVVLLIAMMSYHGIDQIKEERSFIGEYSNIEQEELFEWIKNNTSEDAVFAGKMSLMANVMLSTRRPILNNPFYECKKMRDTTMKVYEIFSRKDPLTVYSSLRSMKVCYVILEEPICLGFANTPSGCQMVNLWDAIDGGTARAAGKQPLCPQLFRGNAYPFRRVFANNYYVVLQLDHLHYIELKPETATPLVHSSDLKSSGIDGSTSRDNKSVFFI